MKVTITKNEKMKSKVLETMKSLMDLIKDPTTTNEDKKLYHNSYNTFAISLLKMSK